MHLVLLPNQFHLPQCTAGQTLRPWGSQQRKVTLTRQPERGENRSLVCHRKDKGLEVFTGWQGPVRHLVTGGSQLEIRKRWGNCGFVQAQGCHVLLNGRHVHKMAVWACSEGGVFDSLKTKGHWADTPASPFRELVVLTSLNRLELKLGTAYPKFLENNLNKHLSISTSDAWRTVKVSAETVKVNLISECRLHFVIKQVIV